MAKTKISEFSATASDNTEIDSINIAEGCAPSGINNAIRELMSQLKDQQTGAAGDNFTVGGTLSVTGSVITPTVISVTDNVNAALRVTQLGTGNALLVEDSTNPDATPFVIDASGNVTIGSLTRDTTGTVNGKTQIQAATGSEASFGQYAWNALAGVNAFFTFNKSRGGAVGTRGAVASNDSLGTIYWAGDDGTNFIRAASISSLVDGTPGLNDMPGRLVFSTSADGASSPSERMRIDSAGGVGIGVTALTGYKLRVAGSLNGATTASSIHSNAEIQSGVTANARSFVSAPTTQATAFTLTALDHFSAVQGTLGAGSAVTNQYGFNAESSLIGATNNYGFYGNIAAGTGRYNLYMAGTAANYFEGNVQVNGSLQYNNGYGSVATVYGCRAWVNFNGTAAGTFAGGTSTVSRTAGSTTATVTTTTAHGLITGSAVSALTGVVAGVYSVTVLTATTFTITTVATTVLTAASITFAVNSIRGSGNVSSVSDNGVGDYTINFITPMPDANYAMTLGADQTASTNELQGAVIFPNGLSAPSARVRYRKGDTITNFDPVVFTAAIFR